MFQWTHATNMFKPHREYIDFCPSLQHHYYPNQWPWLKCCSLFRPPCLRCCRCRPLCCLAQAAPLGRTSYSPHRYTDMLLWHSESCLYIKNHVSTSKMYIWTSDGGIVLSRLLMSSSTFLVDTSEIRVRDRTLINAENVRFCPFILNGTHTQSISQLSHS